MTGVRRIAALIASLALAIATQLVLLLPAAAADVSGGIAVTTVDPSGTVLMGTCFELYTDAGGGTRGALVGTGKRCDQEVRTGDKPGPNDGLMDGITAWGQLAPGSYVVHETLAPGLAGTVAAYETHPDATATVAAGSVTPLKLVHRPVAGLVVHVVDASGVPLPWACFTLRAPDGRQQGICDGPRPGTTSDAVADGLLVLPGLTTSGKPTTYVLTEVVAPAGYAIGGTQSVTAQPTTPTEVTVRHTLGDLGGLSITTEDPIGAALVGGCWELYQDAGGGNLGPLVTGGRRCDQVVPSGDKPGPNDGFMDGTLAWDSLKAGSYVLHQTLGVTYAGTAATFETVADTRVTVDAGKVATREFVLRPTGGLVIHLVDSAGAPLGGACVSLTAPDGRRLGVCDGPRGESTADAVADGLLVLPNLTPLGKPTTYTARVELAPPGYPSGATQSVTVNSNVVTEITIRNQLGGDGGLVVTTVDPGGAPIGGLCVELYSDLGGGARGDRVAGTQHCDLPRSSTEKSTVNDGARDALLAWAALKPGGYIVHEFPDPAFATALPVWETPADAPVTITAGSIATLRLVHRPLGGLTVHVVDGAGRALPGACISLVALDERVFSLCDGPRPTGANPPGDGTADGLLVFGQLATSRGMDYTLRELVAPPAYAPVAEQRVSIDIKKPAELTITHSLDGVTVPPGGPGGTVVTGIDLEITSVTDITLFTYPTSGTSRATGTIPLTHQANGTWAGNGTLSTETLTEGGTCPSVSITGAGDYGWQVRDLRAGPDVAASDISLGMDNEALGAPRDILHLDACAFKDESGTDVWQAMFFDTYSSKRSGFGFLVDGWTITDPNAWTAGGPVAEASWAGQCQKSGLMLCNDKTTFRLIVHVGPAPAGSGAPAPGIPTSDPGAAPGAGGQTPAATLPGGGSPTSGPAAACTDVVSCMGQYWIFLAIGGVALLGGGLAVLRAVRGGAPVIGTRGGAPVITDPTHGGIDAGSDVTSGGPPAPG